MPLTAATLAPLRGGEREYVNELLRRPFRHVFIAYAIPLRFPFPTEAELRKAATAAVDAN